MEREPGGELSQPFAEKQPAAVQPRLQGLLLDAELRAGLFGRQAMEIAQRLRRAGLRAIHPVVDVTNYVMLELGQPMHGFDAATLDRGIVVRRARAGETLVIDIRSAAIDPLLRFQVNVLVDHSETRGAPIETLIMAEGGEAILELADRITLRLDDYRDSVRQQQLDMMNLQANLQVSRTKRQQTIESAKSNRADFAVMAIENARAGSILYNYTLIRESGLKIMGEINLRIRQNLMALPGQK